MEGEKTHFSHEHPLVLNIYHSDVSVSCDGCSEPISGPFYSCEECRYYLHKVCGELPDEMNHPMHPKHPLTLLSKPPISDLIYKCDMCNRFCDRFIYHCFECGFDVDMICASASHMIEDKCHQHPLIPLQHPISFSCHMCLTEEKGLSYKCTICPFWVHQNCTVSLPTSVNHSHHHHPLSFLQFVAQKYSSVVVKCDICYDRLPTFNCVYYCKQCIFFAHVHCARSEQESHLPRSRDQNIESNDNTPPALLPVRGKTTDLISWFAENYRDRDAIKNLILGSDVGRDNNQKEIKFFEHEHSLILIDDQLSEETCRACALPISTPYYGCIKELPDHIIHPAHPQHQISLRFYHLINQCRCCFQWSNGLFYHCFQCEKFRIDIKCASLLRPVKHEAHRHPLIPRFVLSSICSACWRSVRSVYTCYNAIHVASSCALGVLWHHP